MKTFKEVYYKLTFGGADASSEYIYPTLEAAQQAKTDRENFCSYPRKYLIYSVVHTRIEEEDGTLFTDTISTTKVT